MNHNGRMSARWATFLVWALVAASAAAWGLKLFVTAPGAPPQVAVAGQSQLPRGDITRVLGADAPAVDPNAGESLVGTPVDSRFQLLGVVAPRGSETARGAVALIAVDGKPARAFRVGALVDGDHVLQAVRLRGADLGPAGGNVAVALNIPPPAPAATGTLPDARSQGSATPPPPMPARPPAFAPPPTVAPAAPPAAAPRRAPMSAPTPVPQAMPPAALPVGPAQGQVVPLPTPGSSQQPQLR